LLSPFNNPTCSPYKIAPSARASNRRENLYCISLYDYGGNVKLDCIPPDPPSVEFDFTGFLFYTSPQEGAFRRGIERFLGGTYYRARGRIAVTALFSRAVAPQL